MRHFLAFIHTHADYVNFARTCIVIVTAALGYGWLLGLWLTHGANPKPLIHRLSRLANRIYARLLGYFWLPCSQCGNSFGGHEWTYHPFAHRNGESVCPDCAEANIAAAIGPFAPLMEERL
jgi:hypothetical protein